MISSVLGDNVELPPNAIPCNKIELYVCKKTQQKCDEGNDFDGVQYSLLKMFEYCKISVNQIVVDEKDAFGQQLPLLRIENKIIKREDFYNVIRALLHQNVEQTVQERRIIELSNELDEIMTYYSLFSDEFAGSFSNRDAYSWFFSPVKKTIFRWRMRVLANYLGETKNFNSASHLHAKAKEILDKFVEILEAKAASSIPSEFIMAGILKQLSARFPIEHSLQQLYAQKEYDFLNQVAKKFLKDNQVLESLSSEKVQIIVQFEEQEKTENEQNKLSEKKEKKLLVNNVTLSGLSLFMFGMVLMKFLPINEGKRH